VIDFEINTHQFGVDFRFDCISDETVSELVEFFLVRHSTFSIVDRDHTESETILTKGNGTEAAPFFQVRLRGSRFAASARPHVATEEWRHFRNQVTRDFFSVVTNRRRLPVQYVLDIFAETNFGLPLSKLKPTDEVQELKPVTDFCRGFTPPELLKKGNAIVTFSDEEGRESLQWSVGGGGPEEEIVTHIVRRHVLNPSVSVVENSLRHAARSDKLVDDFQREFLVHILESATDQSTQ